LDTSTTVTQLIARDREVYNVAWLHHSTDIFVAAVAADGSLCLYNVRSPKRMTIHFLYEMRNQDCKGAAFSEDIVLTAGRLSRRLRHLTHPH
jgi:WD repeat-containing protein 68